MKMNLLLKLITLIKKVKMKVKTINLKDVKTPKTVEEFRENLRKYYMCLGDDLYVQQLNNVKIDELNSLSDLYDLHPDPMITPQVYWNTDMDNKNYTLFDSMKEYLNYGHPRWVSLDNKLLREFYVKTLGDFSGYVTDKNSQK
jgi:hypothetical protein